MVIKLTLLFLFTASSYALALEGNVTVLDSPIFAEEDEKSKILLYKRKGDSIYIHNGSHPNQESNFYKTALPSGQAGYILKEHVLIVYNDKREIGQKVIPFDHTDYRLPEPLDSDYPFKTKFTGYKGELQIALGQPNIETYPYRQRVLDSSFSLSKEFNFIYIKRANLEDFQDRLYFGAIAGFQVSDIEFVLTSQVAKQSLTTFYIGPYLTYEAYKSEKIGLNLYTNFQVILYNNMAIELKDNDTLEKESREYSDPIGLSPNLGSSISFKKSFLTFDTVLGVNLKGILPKTYTAREEASHPELWRDGDVGDNFNQSLRVELSYFLGLRSSY